MGAFRYGTVMLDVSSGIQTTSITCEADVADSLDGLALRLETPTNYYFWFKTSGGVAVDPGYAGTGVQVDIATGAGGDVVAAALQGAIDGIADFSAGLNATDNTIVEAIPTTGIASCTPSDIDTGFSITESSATGGIRIRRDLPVVGASLFDNLHHQHSNDIMIELIDGDAVGIRFIGQNTPNPTGTNPLQKYMHIYDTVDDDDRYPLYVLTSDRQFISIEGLQVWDIELLGAQATGVAKGKPGEWGIDDSVVQILLLKGGS